MHTSAHHVKDRQELVREREERFQARRSQVRTRATLHALAEKNRSLGSLDRALCYAEKRSI